MTRYLLELDGPQEPLPRNVDRILIPYDYGILHSYSFEDGKVISFTLRMGGEINEADLQEINSLPGVELTKFPK